MKKILHLTVENPSGWTNKIIESQKKLNEVSVEVMVLKTENAMEVLEKIFEAESICVWD